MGYRANTEAHGVPQEVRPCSHGRTCNETGTRDRP